MTATLLQPTNDLASVQADIASVSHPTHVDSSARNLEDMVSAIVNDSDWEDEDNSSDAKDLDDQEE